MPFRIRALAAAAGLALALSPAASAYDLIPDSSLSGNYLAGRTATKLRDIAAASDFYEKALEDDVDNPVLIERVFLLQLADGNLPAAEEHAARVLQFNSQQRMAHIVLGLRDFQRTRFEAARQHFAKSAFTPVGELTSGLLSAWAYAGQKDLNGALKALDKLDSNESFANFKAFHTALIADYLGSGVRAEAAYKQANEGAKSSLRIIQAYGNFLERQGRGAEAQKLYTEFLAGSENHPVIAAALAAAKSGQKPAPFIASAKDGAGEALFSLASAMTDDQSVDVGIMYARLALAMSDDLPVVTTLLGDMYENMSQWQQAITAYDAVPAASPLRVNADIEIATNLQRLDRKDDAAAKLKVLLDSDPANLTAVMTLGSLYRNNEDYVNAGAAYEKAIAMVPQPVKDNWRIFYYAGVAFERQKDWPKAEKYFRRALELSPDEPMTLNYLGYSMIEKKVNLTEALDMVKKAVDLKPNDGYIVDSLGWAYYQLADYEQAVINCERAVDLQPADPIIAEHLGDAYWRAGRTLEAKFQWQHAKDNKPEPDDLKRIEDKIKNGMPADAPVTPAQNGMGGNSG